MKKTYATIRNKMNRMLTITLITGMFWVLHWETMAQVPSCNKFTIGISESGQSMVALGELLNNTPQFPVYLTIRAQDFTIVYEGTVNDMNTEVNLSLCEYVNKELIFEVKNNAGFCSDTLTVSIPPVPVTKGRSVIVLCSDPLLEPGQLIGDSFPNIQYPCAPKPTLQVAEDFVETVACDAYDNSISRIIYREIEGYDAWGQRFSTMDTITVYKTPEITLRHLSLQKNYTLHCGYSEDFGPKAFVKNPISGKMDTISLLTTMKEEGRALRFVPTVFDADCGLEVSVSKTTINNTKCEKRYQIKLELSQKCFYADGTTPLPSEKNPGIQTLERGRKMLTFDVLDVDTLAPSIQLGELLVRTKTSARSCESPLVFPSIDIQEKCSGIRRVHASAPGFFTVNMIKNQNGQWIPEESVVLPTDGVDYVHQGKSEITDFEMSTGSAFSENHQIYTDPMSGFQFIGTNQNNASLKVKGGSCSKMLEVTSKSNNSEAKLEIPLRPIAPEGSIVEVSYSVPTGTGKLILTAYDKEGNEVSVIEEEINSSFCKDAYTYIFDRSISYIQVMKENGSFSIDDFSYRIDTEIKNAFKVYLEASDSCDLSRQDSFYIQAYDETKPTVTLLKNIRVGLTGQLTWIDVSLMNEGSYDNCGVAMVLGRRADWATAGNVSLCDGLEIDKRINPVESYYADYMADLRNGNYACGEFLYDEWKRDSIRYCSGDGPSDVSTDLGGGWTTKIPFTCEDACKDIEVELLVIDYWCNWNTISTTVKVRDKQPISMIQDVKPSIDMNCSSYSGLYANVVSRAAQLNDASWDDTARQSAFRELDHLLGGYTTVWQDLDGQLTDNDGKKVIPSEHFLTVDKSECENYTERKQVQIFDENKGAFVTKMENVPAIRSISVPERIENGIVAVNCSSSTYQKIFVDVDACGTGTIRRRFYVAGGCDEMVGEGDWLARNVNRIEYTREQIIYISPDCELSAGMLDMPAPVSALDVCNIEKNTNGNYKGELHPDFTGWPIYTWSENCRNLSVGYQDKLFRLVGNNPIGQWKLVRAWKIADQCDPFDPNTSSGSVLDFEQIIILNEVEECDSMLNKKLISGRIVSPMGDPIENVNVRIQAKDRDSIRSYTSIQGTYSMSATMNGNYTVVPFKNDETLKGISTYDMVMIQKDVVGIKKLEDPYQQIAADVNNNGLIDAADIIELRKAILRPDFEFANNTSYRFMESTSGMGYGTIKGLVDNQIIDFVGIKIGDVNFSASDAVKSTARRSGMQLVLQDQFLERGNSYRIPVRIGQSKEILGFQFEWSVAEGALESIDLEPAKLNITTENYAVLDKRKLTVSWFDIDENNLEENEVLFYLRLRTKRPISLRELIGPSNDVLQSESYIEPGVVDGLQLKIYKMQDKVGISANHPNPFRSRTTIRYDQEVAGRVDLHIHDVTGKLIMNRQITGRKGINEIILNGADLPSPGMYYYRINTPSHQWTNKMIYIE